MHPALHLRAAGPTQHIETILAQHQALPPLAHMLLSPLGSGCNSLSEGDLEAAFQKS